MNKSSKKVENEEMKNKLNDEIDVENMEIANLIKKDSEDIPKISTDINVINQIRTTGRKNKNKIEQTLKTKQENWLQEQSM